MNKNIKNIMREKIIRIKLSNKNIFKKIIKSISQNNNIKNKVKIYTNYIFDKNLKKHTMQTKKHKICFYTGKRSGIINNYSFSRYKIKSLILGNKLTNIKKNN
jgi:ribosomal protein S14